MATGRLPDPNTAPLTAKGDLYTYSTVPARLAVGSNGDTLVADSSATTGLRWTAGNAIANPVQNSAMQVWQRGTSISQNASTAIYTADRWYSVSGANQALTVSRQTTSDTTNLPNIQFCLRQQRNSGQTGTANINLQQSFESINSIPFAGRTVTFSFYARRGANFSASGNLINVGLHGGTGTDQNYQNGFTGTSDVVYTTQALTTTWARYSFTGTVAATVTQLAISFFWTPTGTAGANDWFEITGLQIDVGSVALPFRTNGATLAGELAACQRYYQVHSRNETWGMGQAYTTSAVQIGVSLIAQMRVAPTITLANAGSSNTTMSFLNSTGNYPGTIGTFSARSITTVGFHMTGTGFTGAFTAGDASAIYAGGEINVYTASAEL